MRVAGAGVSVGVTVGTQTRAGKVTTALLMRALQSANMTSAATAIFVSEPSRLAPARMNVWVRSGYACLPLSGIAMPSICKAPTLAVRQCKMNRSAIKL